MNEVDIRALDGANHFGEEELAILNGFCKHTTDRILKNIMRLGIGDTEQLRKSIHATVHTQANGNSAYVRFYYMNYAHFTELAVGKYFGVDNYLGPGKGVSMSMIGMLPAISGSNFSPLPTKYPKHRSKPFLKSEIRLHLRQTLRMLAAACANTATAYFLHGITEGLGGELTALD